MNSGYTKIESESLKKGYRQRSAGKKEEQGLRAGEMQLNKTVKLLPSFVAY